MKLISINLYLFSSNQKIKKDEDDLEDIDDDDDDLSLDEDNVIYK
jgi:hypothetical protein